MKDAFHRYLINGDVEALLPKGRGTKVAGHYEVTLEPGESYSINCRLTIDGQQLGDKSFAEFDKVFAERIREADHFYATVLPGK